MRELQRRLIVPAFITMTSFTPACGDSKSPTTETDASATTTGTPTTSGATDSTTGGMPPNCEVLVDMPTCVDDVACLWDELGGICVPNCPLIHDEATCVMVNYCEWFDSCLQPV